MMPFGRVIKVLMCNACGCEIKVDPSADEGSLESNIFRASPETCPDCRAPFIHGWDALCTRNQRRSEAMGLLTCNYCGGHVQGPQAPDECPGCGQAFVHGYEAIGQRSLIQGG